MYLANLDSPIVVSCVLREHVRVDSIILLRNRIYFNTQNIRSILICSDYRYVSNNYEGGMICSK